MLNLGFISNIKRNKLAYFLVFPSITYIIFWRLYPAYLGLVTSLTHKGKFVGLRNYIFLLTNSAFLMSIYRTFLWCAFCISATFVVSLFVALILNRSFLGKGAATLILLIPYFVPPWVSAILFLFLYHPSWGLLNPVLKMLGLITTNVNVLGDVNTVLIWIGISWVWRLSPFFSIVLLAGLQSISKELYDAAAVDGANAFKRFRHITLPQLMPTITLSLTFMAMWTWYAFDRVYIMTRGGPADASAILPIIVYREAFEFFHIEIGSAAGMILLALTSLFIIIRLKYIGR